MTLEYAIKWITDHRCPDDWEADCKDVEASRIAKDALRAISKCKRHGPEELPPEGSLVIVYYETYDIYVEEDGTERNFRLEDIGFYLHGRWYVDWKKTFKRVIGWREYLPIEEFLQKFE